MISTIRDYLDILTALLSSSADGANTAPFLDVIKATFLFFCQSFFGFFQYLLTFGWFRDIMYLPVLIPKWQQSVLSEHFFFEDINIEFFTSLSSESSLSPGIMGFFSLGFLNSLFCCLPLSTTHLLAVRRLFVQGVVAGIASTAGIIVGQCAFIFLTIFGIRSAIIPWFSWDPLNYLLGIILLFSVVYEMANERRIRPIDQSEKHVLRNIFLVSILFTWTEQATIAQYLGNVSLGNQPSLLGAVGQAGNLSTHLSYCIGIFVGHCFFSAGLIALVASLQNSLFALSQLPYSVWLKRTNTIFLVGIVGLSFSSTPYYSLDYLLTGPLGFISQDKIFENSIFSQRNMKDPCRLLTSMDVVFPFSIDTDVSYFDRGDYGEQPGFFKRSFEELNYQGEYAWLIRRDKKPNLYSSAQTTRTTIRDLFQFDNNSDSSSGSSLETSSRASQSKSIQPMGTGNQGEVQIDRNSQFQEGNGIGSQVSKEFDSPNQLLLNNPVDFSLEEFDIGQKQAYQASLRKPTSIQGDRDRMKIKKRYEEIYDVGSEIFKTYSIAESFPSFPMLEPSVTPLETTLKQKYYTNRVYQTLLNAEIDAFLNRQPKSYQLTQDEENELFRKRYLLAKYHDTIRAYQQLPYKDEFNEFFNGSKTFVDRAYKHQFKGELSVVRNLFAVTLDSDDNGTKSSTTNQTKQLLESERGSSVLKYDQPLFQPLGFTKVVADSLNKSIDGNLFIHEELDLNTPEKQTQIPGHLRAVKGAFRDPLTPFYKEEPQQKDMPFLELNDSTPFYLGYDNETRQMVLTKRFIALDPEADNIYVDGKGNREKLADAQFKALLQTPSISSQSNVLEGGDKKQTPLTFTTWPLKGDSLLTLKRQPKNKVITLFEPVDNPEMVMLLRIVSDSADEGGNADLFSFPANMKYYNRGFENLVPNQGGFMWPGSQYQYVHISQKDQ